MNHNSNKLDFLHLKVLVIVSCTKNFGKYLPVVFILTTINFSNLLSITELRTLVKFSFTGLKNYSTILLEMGKWEINERTFSLTSGVYEYDEGCCWYQYYMPHHHQSHL